MPAAFDSSDDTCKILDAPAPAVVNDQEYPGVAESHAPATFELYVDDDRYSVPTLHLITAWDSEDAVAVAEARLADSPHHRGVELWQSGRRLLALGAPRRNGL